MSKKLRNVLVAVCTATALWFYMFSPWTGGWPNFWLVMAMSAIILTSLGLIFSGGFKNLPKIEKPLLQLALGVVIAFALWGIFWIGDKASSAMFDFARPEVNAVYAMKEGLSPAVIAVLLILLIGPAEEFFWRGFVQRSLDDVFKGRYARDLSFIATVAIYTLIHIWSFNFMLIMAALVAGGVWGLIYRFCPKALPALVVSHAIWDAIVFVIIPI